MTKPNYTQVDLEQMRDNAYKLVRQRVRAECRIHLVEARSDLEFITAQYDIRKYQAAVHAKHKTLNPLRTTRDELRKQEQEAVRAYRKAYSAYHATLQPVPPPSA